MAGDRIGLPLMQRTLQPPLGKSFVILEVGERWLEQLVVPREMGVGSLQL